MKAVPSQEREGSANRLYPLKFPHLLSEAEHTSDMHNLGLQGKNDDKKHFTANTRSKLATTHVQGIKILQKTLLRKIL